jgi:Peptidase family M28
MRLADLVTAVHEHLDMRAAMADVAAVSEHDRYQASAGIAAAAQYVAERAQAAGLTDVRVLSFPADGAQRWWTYQAPLPWTPLRAALSLGPATVVRYPEQPYALAAYSAATRPGGQLARPLRWSAVRAGADPAGALVVVDEPAALPAVAARLGSGAIAVAMDPLGARAGRLPGQVGRLELLPGSPLAAFSLTADQLRELTAAADAGTDVHVLVELDPASHGVPVVTGTLPGDGDGDGELLMTAHLCHPRPGANDNASGVAALLAAARMLADPALAAGANGGRAAGGRRSVRFLWGPEFVGLAAYLHDVVGRGAAAAPLLAVNVDMAGQDVQRCGGPLVIERGPDDLPSFLPALAERCAALLPPAARSYSGAVPCDRWTWRSTPFAGGSDHALLADEPARCPAITLGHWPDLTNHSSADTLDTVDPAELRRSAAIAGATVAAVRGCQTVPMAADITDATVAWAAELVLGVLPGRRQAGGTVPAAPGDAVFDPQSGEGVLRWLDHRGGVGAAAVRALRLTGAGDEQVRDAADWVGSVATAVRARLTGDATADRRQPATRGPALARNWPGPANLRALAAAASPADRNWLDQQLAADRGGNYARALALMRSTNGARDRHEASWWAAVSSELAIPAPFAARFFDLLCQAGWAVPAAAASPAAPGGPR